MSDFESCPVGTRARLVAAEAELQRLREQEPVEWRYSISGGDGWRRTSSRRVRDELADGGLQVEPLYTAPALPPDVGELVEALELCRNAAGLAGLTGVERTARAALAKHRGES